MIYLDYSATTPVTFDVLDSYNKATKEFMCKDNYQHIFNGNIFDDEKLDYGQRIRKVIKNGTLNINLIGLKECAYIIDNKAHSNIILTILNYINKKLN